MRDQRNAATAVIAKGHRIPTKVTAAEMDKENVSCEESDNDDETAVLIRKPTKPKENLKNKTELAPKLAQSSVSCRTDQEQLKMFCARVGSDEELYQMCIEQYGRTNGDDFAACLFEAIRAINCGINPERIAQGSSGSYFMKNLKGETIGVFKPKNEEPYGSLNPKWVKWAHKLLCPCCFGRSCLVPNQGYLSETGASLVDQKLGLNVVPRTAVVALAAPTFNYGRIDRTVTSTKEQIARNYPDLGRYFKRIGLPPKQGSFQLFVKGFKDAKYWLDRWEQCAEKALPKPSRKEFQRQFEHLIILDYIIRNTDRGNDNWMIFYTPATTVGIKEQQQQGQGQQRKNSSSNRSGNLTESKRTLDNLKQLGKEPAKFAEYGTIIDIDQHDNEQQNNSKMPKSAGSIDNDTWEDVTLPRVKIAAIDNGLAFPFKHPDQWRAYPFQWAKLPMAQVPFSEETVNKILPLLDDTDFVRELGNDLRNIFKTDKGFDKKTFLKQLSVIYGQIFNLREALRSRKTPAQLVQMTPQYMVEIKKKKKKFGKKSCDGTAAEGKMPSTTTRQHQREEKQQQQQQQRSTLIKSSANGNDDDGTMWTAKSKGTTTTQPQQRQQQIVDIVEQPFSSAVDDGEEALAENQLASASTDSYSENVGPAPAQTPDELDDPKSWPNVFRQKVHTRFPLFSCC